MDVLKEYILRDKWYKSYCRFHRIFYYWVNTAYKDQYEENFCFDIECKKEIADLKVYDLEAMINIILEEDEENIYKKINEYSKGNIRVYNLYNNNDILVI
ncbi:MAG: hypothetical protein ACRC7N_11935 [Clostridium sp.]